MLTGIYRYTLFPFNNIKKYFKPTDVHLTLSSDIGFTTTENLKEFFNNTLNKPYLTKVRLQIFPNM